MCQRLFVVVSLLMSVFSAADNSMAAPGTVYEVFSPLVVIDSLDTVYFDIREAVCTGPYIDIPLHIQSDDDVYAIDFAVKLNVEELTFHSVQNYKSYLYEAANFNTGDSTLRFTSFSLVPVENDSDIVGVRFNKSEGYINVLDFTNTTAQLNGDFCSFKVIDTDPAPFLSTGPTVAIQAGDSAHIVVTAASGSSLLWSTGNTTDEIYVDSSGLYLVTVTAPGSGCAAVLSVNVNVAVPLPVEFGAVEVIGHENFVTVGWSTFTETMNDYFVVERSTDGIVWKDIAWVDGAGWSSGLRTYAYNDPVHVDDFLYYRIRQTDFNGDFSWSEVAVVLQTSGSSKSDRRFILTHSVIS